MKDRLDHLSRRHAEFFGGAVRFFRAPGRVNLIGEHTDYNGGFVLPAAIDRDVVIAASPRSDRLVRLWAENFGEGNDFSLDAIARDESAPWSNYVRGMALHLEDAGHQLTGMDAVIHGTVPVGAGLSSSAALEMAAGLSLLFLAGSDLHRRELALLGQQAENEFVGMHCGIMDQFISALGRADHALLIDCRSLEYEQVPLRLEGLALVIADTGVRRELVSSAYNDRRAECDAGLAALAETRPGIHSLRDVTPDDLERFGSKLPPVLARRVRHVVGENARTVAAAETLRRGDHAEFGRLMNESHASCRDLYEVSCPELEALVAAARATDGTLGSRLTGAGFGGATVSLVRQEALETFRKEVTDAYRAATGRTAEIYICSAADGASEIS